MTPIEYEVHLRQYGNRVAEKLTQLSPVQFQAEVTTEKPSPEWKVAHAITFTAPIFLGGLKIVRETNEFEKWHNPDGLAQWIHKNFVEGGLR